MPNRRIRPWYRRLLRPIRAVVWYIGLSFFLLGRLIRGSIRSLGQRWRHGNGRYLVQGLPALAALGGVIYMAVLVVITPHEEIVNTYSTLARISLANRQYSTAKVCYERLLMLDGHKAETQYRLAQVVEAVGDTRRAKALLDQLAPADKPGYVPAHLWAAQRLLSQNHISPADQRVAENHLKRVIAERPDDANARSLLGMMYFATGNLAMARPHLERAVDRRPELGLPLARLKARQGEVAAARIQAERVFQLFQQRTESNPDDHESRLNWAETCLFLGKFSDCLSILEHGYEMENDPRYSQALGRACAVWLDILQRTAESEPTAQLGPDDRYVLIEKGLHYDSANKTLLSHLVNALDSSNETADKARDELNRILANGTAAPTIHLLLGIHAWESGDKDRAKFHWQQSYELNPKSAQVANNLAWVMAHEAPPELERALELSSSVVEQWPDQPRFRDTRGQILAKLGRWKEALKDLELALPVMSKNRDLHVCLAETYKHLNLPDLSQEHSRIAAELEK